MTIKISGSRNSRGDRQLGIAAVIPKYLSLRLLQRSLITVPNREQINFIDRFFQKKRAETESHRGQDTL